MDTSLKHCFYGCDMLWKFINPLASNMINRGVSTQLNKMSAKSNSLS